MNISYQTDILRHQRVIQSPGILYLPLLSMGMLKWTYDPQSNMYLSYNSQTQNEEKNNIKLTFKVYYLCNRSPSSFANQTTLYNTYISRMSKFISKLRINKMENQTHCVKEIDYLTIKEEIEKNEERIGKNILERTVGILQKLVAVRKNANQKMLTFYDKDRNFFENEINIFTNKNNIYNYHEYVLKNMKDKATYYELLAFMQITNFYLENTQDSKIETSVIAYQPNIGQLSLFINPMIMSIFYNMWLQIDFQQQRKKNKPQQQSKVVFPYCNTHSSYFQKVVFINFDGEDNLYALDIFKSFWKYVMYVSFPKNYENFDDMRYNQSWLSHSDISSDSYIDKTMSRQKILERIQRDQKKKAKYITSFKTDDERYAYVEKKLEQQLKTYNILQNELRKSMQDKGEPNEVRKNICLFPLVSPALNERDPNLQQKSRSIQLHESNFIYSTIINYVQKLIQEFVPSLIIISYNGKIHIENHHFAEILKLLAVQANSRLLFFPSMYKTFLDRKFEFLQKQDPDLEDTFKDLIQPFQRFQKYYLNLANNDDLLQKIQIFHTVASGKSNLQSVPTDKRQLHKYKNTQVKQYSAHLLNQLAYSSPNWKRIRNKFDDEIQLVQTLRAAYQYEKYPSYFEEDSWIKTLLRRVRELFFADMREQSDYANNIDLIKLKYQEEDLQEIFEEYELLKYVEQFELKIRRIIYLKLNWKGWDINNPYDNLQPVQFYTIDKDKLVAEFEKLVVENETETEIENENENENENQKMNKDSERTKIFLQERTQVIYHYEALGSIGPNKKERIVFIMNHLYNGKVWKNYYAKVRPKSHNSLNVLQVQQVKLFEFNLPFGEETPDQLTIYSDWNYCETETKCILYWPIKFDFVNHSFYELARISYRKQNMLCSSFFIADINNPGEFTLIASDYPNPLTRCNSVSYEYGSETEIYIFGAETYTSGKYLQPDRPIIRIKLDNSDNSMYINRLSQQYILPYSEYQIYKTQNQVFLFGGYGTRYGSLFSPSSPFYYRINFKELVFREDKNSSLNNSMHIVKFDQKSTYAKMRDSNNFKLSKKEIQAMEIETAHMPINIKEPVKLREDIKSLGVDNRLNGTIEISSGKVPCLASQGYLVSKYFNFIIDQGNQLYRMSSFEEYYFVDPLYYQHTEMFSTITRKHIPYANYHKICNTDLVNNQHYLKMKVNDSNNDLNRCEVDFLFLPMVQLLALRQQTFKQNLPKLHYDLLSSVDAMCKNNNSVMIIFRHPRITMGMWVIAQYKINQKDATDEKRMQIKFDAAMCFEPKFSDYYIKGEKFINLLDNQDIILSCYDKLTLNIMIIDSEDRNKTPVVLLRTEIKEFNIITYTYSNLILYIIYFNESYKTQNKFLLKFYVLYQNPKYLKNSKEQKYLFEGFSQPQYLIVDKKCDNDVRLEIMYLDSVDQTLFGNNKYVDICFKVKASKDAKECDMKQLQIKDTSLDHYLAVYHRESNEEMMVQK